MEQQSVRHTGIIESFELEDPSWPVITPRAKGTVRSALDSKLYDVPGSEFVGKQHLLPFVGLSISFYLFIKDGKVIAGDIRFENSGRDA